MTGSPTLIFTGGHHTSALVVAEALKNSGVSVIWLGHRYSVWGDTRDSAEYREVTASGIPFYDLHAGKLYRTYHPLKLLRLPGGCLQAFIILLRLKLELRSNLKGVVSFGGYLAVPVVFAGWLLHIPSLTHEQTLSAGWANRFISRFVKKIALSWPESSVHYPPSKSVVTGLPLRPQIITLKPHLTHPPTIYITGGKQGSHVINLTVFAALPHLLDNFCLVHQTGNNTVFKDYEAALQLRARLSSLHQSRYSVFPYLSPDDVARVFSRSSLVVSRSGAHIIHELAYLKLRCVLIPIPWSSHNEQTQNAELLVSYRQAVLLPQSELNSDSLVSAIHQALELKPSPPDISRDGLNRLVQLIKQELL